MTNMTEGEIKALQIKAAEICAHIDEIAAEFKGRFASFFRGS